MGVGLIVLRGITVAIDITQDKLVSLEDAAKMFPKPGGGHIHPKTVKNWITQGYQGITLEGAQVGSKFYTTKDALRLFSQRLSERRPAGSRDFARPPSSEEKHGVPEESLAAEDFVVSDEFNIAGSDTVAGNGELTVELPCAPVVRNAD